MQDIAAQTEFLLAARDRMSAIAEMALTIRSLREQIEDRNGRLAGRDDMQELVQMGKALVEKLEPIETALYDPTAEVDYDLLAGREGGAKLYSRYGWLTGTADDHEGPPTQGMREVAELLGQELAVQQRALDELISNDLARLNALAAERGVPYVE